MKKTLVIDLDDTICFPNHEFKDTERKYGEAKPNEEFISKMVEIHDTFLIVINSARRMLTHNGDLDKIEDDVRDITERWLEKYEVPYDELRFGKPYGEYYIDDKALSIRDFLEGRLEGI